jgi:hypothetical protein
LVGWWRITGMNWEKLLERLEQREKQAIDNLIIEEDEKEKVILQQKIKVYREERRDIKKILKGE